MKATAIREPVWTPPAVSVAAAGLMVEAACAVTALWIWGLFHPHPDDDGGALAVFVLPVVLPVLAGAALALTVTLIMPTLSLARRAGALWGHGGAWWWVPAMAGIVSAAVVGAGGLGFGLLGDTVGSPSAYAWWWLAVALLIVPGALLARETNRRTAQGRPRLRTRKVLLGGCGSLAALCALLLTTAVVVESVAG